MWRAHLADGRVVDHDGHNSPQPFLDLIVKFEVFAPNGAMLARLEPGPRDRLIWRWVRENNGRKQRTVGVKVGILNRDSGELDLRLFENGQWVPTDDVVLSEAELA